MSPHDPERPRAAPFLEIQIHPSEIRRRVRYLFLSRRQAYGWVLALAFVLLFVLGNLVIAPKVYGDLWSRGAYRSLIDERRQKGVRLQGLVERLGVVRQQTEELNLRMSRILVAYGLSSEESLGQGGFPFESREVPESIFSRQIERGLLTEARASEELRVLETFVNEVQSFEEAHGDRVRTTPSTSPVRPESFVLTSPFGSRRSPFTKQIDFHPGIDLAATVGTPVYAPADGRVVFAGRMPLRQSVAWWRYGNLVAIRNGDRFITLYGHCEEVKVRNGQRVSQGDLIATVGNTGWSTSPHLHYEVRARGEDGEFKPVDPRIYILDHRWRDEEELLVRARRAPDPRNFEPLPRIIGR
jgi:murein DD-endopeptidase MepM/ murein hydrolase activator NlpD